MLKNAVERVKNEEDPVELNQYKKLFKKNVPFTLRSYVAAYLAKNSGFTGRRENFRNRRDGFKGRGRYDQGEKFFRQDREPAPRVVIDEELAATVFISIGRNRRVFPRDLISLIVQNSSVERSRIGDIRVLDNYSFVQLYAEDCDKVISSLDGLEYRGRKLSCSYSRKNDDAEVVASDAIDNEVLNAEDNYQYDEEDRAAYALAEKAVEAAAKQHGNY
ncbi:MAG: DbpA RNA binding domain-containing protein [Spirochaetaceae bacterium]|nr:DbpA RNA binding domain-containing protein [Spirochaetaceae bacterium]MBQ4555289.1 DbpA RNA binding domain-containing protein [Spirochaetaceae bacterium]